MFLKTGGEKMSFLFIILFSFSAIAENGVAGSESPTLDMSQQGGSDEAPEFDTVFKHNQEPSSIMGYNPTQGEMSPLGPYDLASLRALYLSDSTYPTVESMQNLIAVLEKTCDTYSPSCELKIVLEEACLVQDERGNFIQRCSYVEFFELRRVIYEAQAQVHNFSVPRISEVFVIDQSDSFVSVMDYPSDYPSKPIP